MPRASGRPRPLPGSRWPGPPTPLTLQHLRHRESAVASCTLRAARGTPGPLTFCGEGPSGGLALAPAAPWSYLNDWGLLQAVTHGKLVGKWGEEPTIQWLPRTGVKNWPCWREANDPLYSCPPQVRVTPSLTTPSSAGALSPTTSITGQLQTQRKWLSGLENGEQQRRGQAGGTRGRSPECLGVGHRSRPVNIQVSAATGRGRGKHFRTGWGYVSPSLILLYVSHPSTMTIRVQHPWRPQAGPRVGAQGHPVVSIVEQGLRDPNRQNPNRETGTCSAGTEVFRAPHAQLLSRPPQTYAR